MIGIMSFFVYSYALYNSPDIYLKGLGEKTLNQRHSMNW
jgi:hypothetical protein